jgi:hypothetical protein
MSIEHRSRAAVTPQSVRRSPHATVPLSPPARPSDFERWRDRVASDAIDELAEYYKATGGFKCEESSHG